MACRCVYLLTFSEGAGILDLPAPPAALLGPGGYQSTVKAVIPHALVIPRSIVVSHAATPFLCSVLGVASAGGGSLCLGVSPLDTAIIQQSLNAVKYLFKVFPKYFLFSACNYKAYTV